jgi:hypothetical protein
MEKEFKIDDQIRSIESEIAEYTEKLFEAKGMLRLALHLKQTCDIKLKEKAIASSGHPGQ